MLHPRCAIVRLLLQELVVAWNFEACWLGMQCEDLEVCLAEKQSVCLVSNWQQQGCWLLWRRKATNLERYS